MTWLLKLLGGSTWVYLAIAGAAIAVSAGATGWKLNGWRLSGTIERLEGRAAALEGANQRCGVNVAEVKAAVEEISKQGELRAQQATRAIHAAEASALKHLNRAAGIIKRPPVPPEKQCDTVRDEQVEYVRDRRNEVEP